MDRYSLRFASIYLSASIVIWQLAVLTDRVVPVPNSAVAAVPWLAALAFPFAWVAFQRRSIPESTIGFPRPLPVGTLLLVAVIAAALVPVLAGPVRACPPGAPGDCTDYVAMVGNLRYDPARAHNHVWEGYGTHYYMRVLPPLLVAGLGQLGIGIDDGFRMVSAGAWLVFAVGLYLVLLGVGRDPLRAAAFALIILGSHRVMTHSLRHVHYSPDALTYPLALGLVWLTIRNRWRPVFLLALLGIITKQNLFALSGLCLGWLWIQNHDARSRIEIAVLGVTSVAAYAAVSTYYHATGTVARHAMLDEGNLASSFRYAFEQGGLELILPLLPILVLYGPQTAPFLRRYWFVALFVVLSIAQPMIAYEITGNSFRRLALQGVWLLYLAAALVAVRRPAPEWLRWALLAYGATMFTSPAPDVRLIAASLMTIVAISAISQRWARPTAVPAPPPEMLRRTA